MVVTRLFVRSCLRRMREASVPEPKESISHFLSEVLDMKMYQLDLRRLPHCLTEDQANRLHKMVIRRLHREPVQYIIGHWDFRKLNVAVRAPVLIPRPETEILVDLVRDHIEDLPVSNVSVLEVGCGAGPVALSLLKEVETKNLRVVAVDCNPEAVELTRENAERNGLTSGLDVRLHRVDEGTKSIEVLKNALRGKADVVVSNPPYIMSGEMSHIEPEVSKFEDREALDGGVDGLDMVRTIFAVAPRVLKHAGRIFLEVDTRHPQRIECELLAPTSSLGRCLRYHRMYEDQTFRSRFVEVVHN